MLEFVCFLVRALLSVSTHLVCNIILMEVGRALMEVMTLRRRYHGKSWFSDPLVSLSFHCSQSARKLIATIEATLTSATTAKSGDSVQRCLTVLMALARCPFLHSSSIDAGNMRGLIMAVTRLNVIKLQAGVSGASTGTGYTRFGGTRRSLLVEKEVLLLVCYDVCYCVTFFGDTKTMSGSLSSQLKPRVERIRCRAVPTQMDGLGTVVGVCPRSRFRCTVLESC